MDYHNRAGSKKGGGGIATESQFNTQRRKQVETLLRGDEHVPFTFATTNTTNNDGNIEPEYDLSRQNPYIYKNHSGKLVCKLCNTMHMSWTSVERHLQGKKHGLNVIRRNNALGMKRGESFTSDDISGSSSSLEFQKSVEAMRQKLKYDAGVPQCSVVPIKDPSNGNIGVAMRIVYPPITKKSGGKEEETSREEHKESFPPFLRIVSGLELQNNKERDRKYLVIAYPPFSNISLEIPAIGKVLGGAGVSKSDDKKVGSTFIDDLNQNCTFWNPENRCFFVQCFFSTESIADADA